MTASAIDVFTVPAATFRVLVVFVVLSHERRRVLHFNVTEHPTAAWTAQQLREAWPWNDTPRFVVRNRDCIYGETFRAAVHGLGIGEILTAPRWPVGRSLATDLGMSQFAGASSHLQEKRRSETADSVRPAVVRRVWTKLGVGVDRGGWSYR